MSSISAGIWEAPRRNASLTSTFSLVALMTLATVSAAMALSTPNGNTDNNLIDTSVPQIVTTAGP